MSGCQEEEVWEVGLGRVFKVEGMAQKRPTRQPDVMSALNALTCCGMLLSEGRT